MPENIEAARLQAAKFLNGGKDAAETPEEDEAGADVQPRAYSMDKDSRWIFAAFMQTHGINLEAEDLHFWTFLTLFAGLGEDTFFCKLVGLRIRMNNGTATDDDRKWARTLGDIYELKQPDTSTPEELDMKAEFDRLVELGRQKEKKNKK